jgi:cholest-4-en-3-one 26-monooxygenase
LPLTDEINLLDAEIFFARGVPHEWFTYLRAHEPVYRHPEPDGPGFWVITKHKDVRDVEREFATFSSAAERGGVAPLTGRDGSYAAGHDDAKAMLELDPPEHTDYRRIVSDPFRRRSIAGIEDEIRTHTVRALDGAVAQRTVDFVQVAARISTQVIGSMLGMPDDDRHLIAKWCDSTAEEGPDTTFESFEAVNMEIAEHAGRLAGSREREPRDDLTSILLAARIGGRPLSPMDFVASFGLLAVAGEITTRTALSQGIQSFIEHPDEYARLVDDPSLVDTAVEEILRWGTPALYFRRNVTRDTEIRGVPIKEGDRVSIWYISANRDEEVFDDPFRFDVGRRPNDHISFGEGRHLCLGIHLARAEIKIFFEELIQRVSRITSAGEPVRLRSNLEHGFRQLPVGFEPLT